VVLRRCDLPICVRLDHLATDSQRDNVTDGRPSRPHRQDDLHRPAHRPRRQTRAQAGQSHAIRDAVRHLITGITDPHQLTAIVDEVVTLGDRYAGQLALFDI
jgi:hypothetical protein